MKSKLYLFMPIVLIITLCINFCTVFANESESTEMKAELTQSAIADTIGVEKVTFDELNDKIHTKTYEVVKLLQTFGRPFVIACFIVSLIVMVMGAITGGKGKEIGLVGIIICVIAYVGIQNAHTIVTFAAKWMAS